MIYNNDGPVYSSLSGKSNVPALLSLCVGSVCGDENVSGNLCNIELLNACPGDNYCGLPASQISSMMTGSADATVVPYPPAALACCSSDIVTYTFSQNFLDEVDWSLYWCSDYANNVCGYMPVNDYNKCQYLMYHNSHTEDGDYCDRIHLYTDGLYSSATLATTCS